MKSVLHKSVSLAMAVLLLLSTTSWKVEKHYCMGSLMDVAFFSDADSCGMNMSTADDSKNIESSCCDDQVLFVSGQDDLKISFNDLETEQQSFLVAFGVSYFNLLQVHTEQLVPNEQYPPPIIVKDIQLLDEVYLI